MGEKVVRTPTDLRNCLLYGGVGLIDEATEAEADVVKGFLNGILDGSNTFKDLDGTNKPIHQDCVLVLTSNLGDAEKFITSNDMDPSTKDRLRGFRFMDYDEEALVEILMKQTGYTVKTDVKKIVKLLFGSRSGCIKNFLKEESIADSVTIRKAKNWINNYQFYWKDAGVEHPWVEAARSSVVEILAVNEDPSIQDAILALIEAKF